MESPKSRLAFDWSLVANSNKILWTGVVDGWAGD